MHLIRPLLLAISILAAPLAGAWADEPTAGGRKITLEDRLKTGLRARRPEEIEFIEDVAGLVRVGRLPEKIVDSTYLWAVQRQRKYPFPLFERALRIQADRLGVDL